jgi:transcriptional regulator with XRE-family HTH domain
MSTAYPKRLAAKLKHIRVIELDLSEQEMADRLGVTEREVEEYERGARECPLSLVVEYAKCIGLSPYVLVNDASEIRPNWKGKEE